MMTVKQRHALRTRPVNKPTTLPSAAAREFLERVRAVDDAEAAVTVDSVQRLLLRRCIDEQLDSPPVIAIRVGKLGVELVLDKPSFDPPTGFATNDDGGSRVSLRFAREPLGSQRGAEAAE